MINAAMEMMINDNPMRGEEIIARIRRTDREEVIRAARKVRLDTIYCLTKEEGS